MPRNPGLAINCYLQAAEKWDTQAMMRLSELCMPGSEGEADVVEAYKWLYLASQNADGNATLTLLAVRERLTPAQALEACRRVEDFERAFGKTTAKM